MNINDLTYIGQLPGVASVLPKTGLFLEDESSGEGGASGFADVFKESWERYDELSAASKESTAMLLTGQLDDMPAHMVAGEKSGVQFELNLAVRNKVMEAYNEVMKTQV